MNLGGKIDGGLSLDLQEAGQQLAKEGKVIVMVYHTSDGKSPHGLISSIALIK